VQACGYFAFWLIQQKSSQQAHKRRFYRSVSGPWPNRLHGASAYVFGTFSTVAACCYRLADGVSIRGRLLQRIIYLYALQNEHLGTLIGILHRFNLKLAAIEPNLRHTFLTRLGAGGCDVWSLMRIAGHSSIAISMQYVHPSDETVLDAVERLGGHNSGHSAQTDASDGIGLEAASAVIPEGYLVSAAGFEPATHALKGSPTQLQTTTCTSSLLHARHNKIK